MDMQCTDHQNKNSNYWISAKILGIGSAFILFGFWLCIMVFVGIRLNNTHVDSCTLANDLFIWTAFMGPLNGFVITISISTKQRRHKQMDSKFGRNEKIDCGSRENSPTKSVFSTKFVCCFTAFWSWYTHECQNIHLHTPACRNMHTDGCERGINTHYGCVYTGDLSIKISFFMNVSTKFVSGCVTSLI